MYYGIKGDFMQPYFTEFWEKINQILLKFYM